MLNTPIAFRKHIAFFGPANSGKSSLFNAFLGQDAAIVSDIAGTTTDPVIKACELIPFGPIALIDTAGLADTSLLGAARKRKTLAVLDRTDVAVYVADPSDLHSDSYLFLKSEFDKRKIPHLFVLSKSDLYDSYSNNELCVSVFDKSSIEMLKVKVIELLRKRELTETVMGDLLPKGCVVVMVIPVDSEMPKGRLILPQVALIRECLDADFRCNITTVNSLNSVISESKRIDIVICDSQVFHEVNEITQGIPLTSFSIIMALKKGNIETFVSGAKSIDLLKNNASILVAEACTHTKTHEDIGTVKLPGLLKKYTSKDLHFVHCYGHDFPDDISSFDLIIHCGGCMIPKTEILNRISLANKANVPITNYGVALAFLNGILERCLEFLKKQDTL